MIPSQYCVRGVPFRWFGSTQYLDLVVVAPLQIYGSIDCTGLFDMPNMRRTAIVFYSDWVGKETELLTISSIGLNNVELSDGRWFYDTTDGELCRVEVDSATGDTVFRYTNRTIWGTLTERAARGNFDFEFDGIHSGHHRIAPFFGDAPSIIGASPLASIKSSGDVEASVLKGL